MPATTGTLGLFTLEVGDTLPKKAVSISGYANKISREPGSISVVSAGWTVAAGLHDRVNVYFQFEPHRHVHASRPGRLSFNSPLANPQFGTTIYRSLTSAVGSAPGYVEDFPFANANGGGVGEVTLGMKFGVWSEWRGDPLSFSIRNDFIIPTRTILSDLLDNQGQSGQFNNNVGVAVSKTFRDLITGAFNFNYRFTRDPRFGGTRALEQADQARFGVGFLMFPQKRVQLMTEYSALIFTGAHTANTSFGPRNSVEGLWGVRLYPYRNISIDLGYRQNISLSQHGDRHGLVVKVSTVYWPHQ